MMLNRDLPHARLPLRLNGFDYSTAGAYFVTICTQNRACLFGQIGAMVNEIEPPPVVLSDAGRMLETVWREIPAHYPGIEIDEFVVMPDHVHGIIVIENANYKVPPAAEGRPQGASPTGLTVPDVIHRFKTLTTKRYTNSVKECGWRRFDGVLWQRSFYEHVIRSETELNNTRQYILSNPLNWALDRENPEFTGK